MQTTLFGPSAQDQASPQANPGRLVNLFREPVQEGGITKQLLRSCQGMSQRVASPELFARDLVELSGTIYAAIGSGLYRIGATAVKVASLSAADAYLSKNGNKITVVSGTTYSVWDGSALTSYTGAITKFGSVTYLAGRTIISEYDGNKFQWSDVADPTTLNGLNFASAEQRDDKLLRVMAVNGILMAFGERSTEIWAATGLGGANAFQLLPGAVIDTGIKSRTLVAPINGGCFLVGSDGMAYIASGTTWEPVSSPAVNSAIRESAPERCIYWEYAGHKFAAITFPNRAAWVFDMATKEWHERTDGDNGDWPIACAVPFAGSWVFGGDSGALYNPVVDGTDFGAPMRRQATSGMIDNAGAYLTINAIEFGAAYGYQTISATLMLETSRDGVTWGEPVTVDVGSAGDFGKRAIFRRLGTSRRFAFRLTFADACDFAVYSDANIR